MATAAFALAVRQTDLAGEHFEAGRQALHVPLKGPGQGLVEVRRS